MKFLIFIGAFFLFAFSAFSQIPKNLQTQIKEFVQNDVILLDNFEIVDELLLEGFVQREGTDKDTRPTFVTLQAVIEKVLANALKTGEVSKFVGSIHTPCPTTPLCSNGNITKKLVTSEIDKDPKRKSTVLARTQTVRELLFHGGKLFIVYPKEGLLIRTQKQREIYQQELFNFSDVLFDFPINTSLPDNLIGATYIFKDREGIEYLFSIQATQANDARNGCNWKLWLDQIEQPNANARFEQIDDFLQKNIELSLMVFL